MRTEQNLDNAIVACSLLFGSGVNVTADFINHLQPNGLKSAFRQKIKETHPDKSVELGLSKEILTNKFREITDAYEVLIPIVKGGKGFLFTTQTEAKSKPNFQEHKEKKDQFYRGNMVNRKLKFGMFLYYKGLVSWKMLMESILWQRKNRPLIGQLAYEWKMISMDDVSNIMFKANPNESFGRAAVRFKRLTNYQVSALLGKQSSFDCKVGKYFVDRGVFSNNELNGLLAEFRSHNFRMR